MAGDLDAPLLDASHGDPVEVYIEDGTLEHTEDPYDPEFQPEDYTTLLYNLKSWSYRVSRLEYQYYQQHRLQQIRATVGTDAIITRQISQTHHSSYQQRHAQGVRRPSQQPRRPSSHHHDQGSGIPIHHCVRHRELEHLEQHRLTAAHQQPPASRLLARDSSVKRWARSWSPLHHPRHVPFWMGFPMLPATHGCMLGWAMFMLLCDLVYTALLLPLFFAFDLNHFGNRYFWLSSSMGLLFIIDMLVVMHRGVVIRYLDYHMYVDLPMDVARLYVRYGHFWTDLVVALSTPLHMLSQLGLPAAKDAQQEMLFALLLKCLPLMRGLRLMKLLLLQRELFLGKLGLRHATSRSIGFICSLVYVLAVLLNWLACIMLFIAHNEEQEVSWLADVKSQDLTGASGFTQYVASIYWMSVTTTTVGYGDVSAGTPVEQLAVLGAVATGVSFIAYSIKTLMDVMMETALQDESAQRVRLLRDRARILKMWSTWQDLPQHLMDRINSYSAGPWVTNAVLQSSWDSALAGLPPDLKGEMLLVMLVERHKELAPLGRRLIKGLGRPSALALLSLLEPRPLAPGEMLAWEGDQATDIWLLQEGSLVELVGVLPTGPTKLPPGLIAAHDLIGWIEQQLSRHKARRGRGHRHKSATRSSRTSEAGSSSGTEPPLRHRSQEQGQQTDEAAGGGDGGQDGTEEEAQQEGGCGMEKDEKRLMQAEARSWVYDRSLQSTNISFLWALPLSRLALALHCMPQLGENMIQEMLHEQPPPAVQQQQQQRQVQAQCAAQQLA